MEFIKKNWGLLICIIVFIAGVIYLAIKIAGKNAEYAASEQKVAAHKAWFQKVNSDGWRITADDNNRLENTAIAQKNQATAEAHLKDIRSELIRRYSFNPEIPRNDADAKNRLNKRLRALESLVIKNKVLWESENMGGALHDLAVQSDRINPEDFKAVFRQLEIYERMTRDIVESGIKEVTHLSFPRKWSVEENGDYTITPVLVGVTATPEVLQKFVNTLADDKRMLSIIRSIEFLPAGENNEEIFNDIVMENQQESTQLNQNFDEKQKDGAMLGSSTRTSRRSSRSDAAMGVSSRSSRRSSASPAMDAPGSMGGLNGSYNEEDLVKEDPKRQDYLVFRTPRSLELRLNLDVIEYVDTEAEEE